MEPFGNYEISPCLRLNDQGEPDPKGNNFEVCSEGEAHVWTLYGHIDGEGVEAIADFPSREDAEELFRRITGRPFGTWEENAAHIRRMRAAAALLDALAKGKSASWVHNVAVTQDVEALRRICLEHATWWNDLAAPLLESLRAEPAA